MLGATPKFWRTLRLFGSVYVHAIIVSECDTSGLSPFDEGIMDQISDKPVRK